MKMYYWFYTENEYESIKKGILPIEAPLFDDIEEMRENIHFEIYGSASETSCLPTKFGAIEVDVDEADLEEPVNYCENFYNPETEAEEDVDYNFRLTKREIELPIEAYKNVEFQEFGLVQAIDFYIEELF